MPQYEFLWTEEIIAHLAEHGVSPDEFEDAVSFADTRGVSRSSGRPCCWGDTSNGRRLFCAYEFIDSVTILPITAFEIPDREPE